MTAQQQALADALRQCREALAMAPDWQLLKTQRLIVNAAREAADAALAQQEPATPAEGLPEPVAYWFRHINTDGEPTTAWKPVEPRNAYMNTVEDSVRELLAYRFQDKPCYEVMPVHTADQLHAHAERARREALEEAANEAQNWADGFAIADAIRALAAPTSKES